MSSTTVCLCIRHPHIMPSQSANISYSTLQSPFIGIYIYTYCSSEATNTVTPLRTKQEHLCMCVSVCEQAVACEPEWDKIIKILLTVQEVSNYKQAYFSTQLKLTN